MLQSFEPAGARIAAIPMKPRAALAAALALAAVTASAQGDLCDPALKGKEDQRNPNAYRLRADRCEGIFIQEVAAVGNLLVASLTASMQGFTPDPAKPIDVEWKAPGPGKLSLRAYSLRPRFYYRMDTTLDAPSGVFHWQSGILATYALKASEVGLVGWTSYVVAGRTLDPVYVPVGVRETKSSAWPLSYRLVVVPPADLKKMYLTVSHLTPSGTLEKPLREGELGYGYYPANGAVKIDLANLPVTGTYLVQLAAERKDGADTVTKFWFYRP
jgi:hypothetical protein